MFTSIILPDTRNLTSHSTHIRYFAKLMKAAGAVVDVDDSIPPYGRHVMLCEFKRGPFTKRIVIDYNNHHSSFKRYSARDGFDAYFKYQCTIQQAAMPRIFPIPKISFYDWKQYRRLSNKITYDPSPGKAIINRQSPAFKALKRRMKVRRMLAKKFRSRVRVDRVGQMQYWQEIAECLVHVCVPGARNDILDRGQLQYIAFGCCTISPEITDILPYYSPLIPGVHYVQCSQDYSDLIDKICWCENNVDQCKEIGQNAKELFTNTCVPPRVLDWMLLSLELN